MSHKDYVLVENCLCGASLYRFLVEVNWWCVRFRDDDSHEDLDDQDIHKIMIETQSPSAMKRHNCTGNHIKRSKLTSLQRSSIMGCTTTNR